MYCGTTDTDTVCYTPEISKILLVYVKYFKYIRVENLKMESQAELVLKFFLDFRPFSGSCLL